jgi:hypothetical protein
VVAVLEIEGIERRQKSSRLHTNIQATIGQRTREPVLAGKAKTEFPKSLDSDQSK